MKAQISTEPSSYASRGTYHPDAEFFIADIDVGHREVTISFDSNPGLKGRRCRVGISQSDLMKALIKMHGNRRMLIEQVLNDEFSELDKLKVEGQRHKKAAQRLLRVIGGLKVRLARYAKERAAGIR